MFLDLAHRTVAVMLVLKELCWIRNDGIQTWVIKDRISGNAECRLPNSRPQC